MPEETLNVFVSDELVIDESFSSSNESLYLITSNKSRCRAILAKTNLGEEDFIDFLVSIHLVLEIGLNCLFRDIAIGGIKKQIDESTVAKDVDNIDFIEKVTLFIYNSNFDFELGDSDATTHHKIIGKIRNFNFARNRLLHGHAIRTYIKNGLPVNSEARSSLNDEYMRAQILRFKDVIKGIKFYLDHLVCNLTTDDKVNLKNRFLNDDFLNT